MVNYQPWHYMKRSVFFVEVAVKILSKQNLIPGDKLPLTTGDCFRVINGKIDLINEEVYYIVDIEIIPENRKA